MYLVLLVDDDDFMNNINSDADKFVCYLAENNVHLLENTNLSSNVIILIGPEGDFSEKEINLALEKGFKPTGLGTQRLRTETAGIVACQYVHTLKYLYPN